MTRRFLFWSTAVLLLAAFMRVAWLQDVPPGLAQDEVLNADVASFIRGGYHALFFREGYGHEPLYHYWQVPFQVLLGDNVLSVRLPAVFLGLLLVALTLRWAMRAFGLRVAILAGTLLAVSWWPIIFSRIGLRPILEPLMLLLFAWFWPKRPWLAGLFLGLSLYTYTGARVVFAIPLLLALYGLITRAPRHPLRNEFVRRALITLLTALILFVPLWLTLRADPTLQQRVDQLAGPLDALAEGDVQPLLDSTLATLGVFAFTGDPRWTYTLPDRPLFDPITAVFFATGLLLSFWRWRKPTYALVLIWLAVGLVPSAVTPDAPSTVRLVGAMPVVYLLPAIGLDWLWGVVAERGQLANRRRLATAVVGVLVVALLGWNLVRTVRDGFIAWPQALETRLKYQSVLLDMARYWDANPHQPLVIADGFYRPITVDTLRRNLGRPLAARWVQTGETVAGALVIPAEGDGLLTVPEYAAPAAQLLERATVGDVEYRSSQSPSFAVYQLDDTFVPGQQVNERFEGKIRLVGYEILPSDSDQAIQMMTVWRVEGPLPEDLAAFAHLIGPDDTLISQHDGFDAAPATLLSGDMVLQHHVIPLPEGEPVDGATLQVGLYVRENGRRLLLDSPADGAPPDRVVIGALANVDQGEVDR